MATWRWSNCRSSWLTGPTASQSWRDDFCNYRRWADWYQIRLDQNWFIYHMNHISYIFIYMYIYIFQSHRTMKASHDATMAKVDELSTQLKDERLKSLDLEKQLQSSNIHRIEIQQVNKICHFLWYECIRFVKWWCLHSTFFLATAKIILHN